MKKLFNFFKNEQEKNPANVAKERLKVIVAHERRQRNQPDYLQDLQRDLMLVIQKYVEIEADNVQVQLDSEGNYSVLELNVTLPN